MADLNVLWEKKMSNGEHVPQPRGMDIGTIGVILIVLCILGGLAVAFSDIHLSDLSRIPEPGEKRGRWIK